MHNVLGAESLRKSSSEVDWPTTSITVTKQILDHNLQADHMVYYIR